MTGRNQFRNGPVIALACAVAGWLAAMSAVNPTLAHFWYPRECCNDQDCFPVTSMRRNPDGSLSIEARHISVLVPPGFPSRVSQDNDAHVCVYRDLSGRYHARCLFLPGVT